MANNYQHLLSQLTLSLPPFGLVFFIVLVLILVASLVMPPILPPIISISTAIVVLDEVIPEKSALDDVLVLILVDFIVDFVGCGFALRWRNITKGGRERRINEEEEKKVRFTKPESIDSKVGTTAWTEGRR